MRIFPTYKKILTKHLQKILIRKMSLKHPSSPNCQSQLLLPSKRACVASGDFSTNSNSKITMPSFVSHFQRGSPIVFRDLSSADLSSKGYSHKGIIGTHSGTFHCDDVTACVMLKLLPQYSDHIIVRTRDENLLKDFDIIVDVGSVFDPNKHRYDHHQKTFNECMNSLNSDYPWITKLSSAGLVYFHFGHKILATVLNLPENAEEIKVIYKKIYENFLEEIDGLDNGIDASPVKPRYSISTNLSSRVGFINPTWNSTSNETFEEKFTEACIMVQTEFLDKIFFYHNSWWPAREIVQNAINNRFQVHKSGEIIEFHKGGCPWKDHLMSLEKEMNLEGVIKFVIYSDDKNLWRVQAVPLALNTFENRVSLKKEWRGLRDAQLNEVSNVKDCTFVHISGFTGGNCTRDGAISMAVESIAASETEK